MNVHVRQQPSSMADATALWASADGLAKSFAGCDLFERVVLTREALPGRIVLTTGFGLEGQAITHTIFTQDLPIEVVTIDTGRLHPETYDVWAATEHRYNRRIRALFPARSGIEAWVERHGIDGFRSSVAAREACCQIRKVEPLGRILAGTTGWITGIRAEQSALRARSAFAEFDAAHSLVKANPLFDWSRAEVIDFVREHGIPYNSLHDRGFPSVGCAPCTRAVAPGEGERAGRWWWEEDEKKECGLHLARTPPTP